jgi:hypothetical protein
MFCPCLYKAIILSIICVLFTMLLSVHCDFPSTDAKDSSKLLPAAWLPAVDATNAATCSKIGPHLHL